jgi:hypothetical protein
MSRQSFNVDRICPFVVFLSILFILHKSVASIVCSCPLSLTLCIIPMPRNVAKMAKTLEECYSVPAIALPMANTNQPKELIFAEGHHYE